MVQRGKKKVAARPRKKPAAIKGAITVILRIPAGRYPTSMIEAIQRYAPAGTTLEARDADTAEHLLGPVTRVGNEWREMGNK